MQEAGFETAVREHRDGLHAFAFRMLRDREEALDVAQEALIRLWRNRERVELPTARAWLMRTVHNLCIDRIRHRKTRSEVDEGDNVIAMRPTTSHGPERLALAGDLGRQLEEALERLSATDRAVVLLREVQQLPYGEICDVLDVPLGTLKARLHRARERLRVELTRRGTTPANLREES